MAKEKYGLKLDWEVRSMPGGFVLLPTVALQWEDGLTLVLIWGQWALEVGQASHKGW